MGLALGTPGHMGVAAECNVCQQGWEGGCSSFRKRHKGSSGQKVGKGLPGAVRVHPLVQNSSPALRASRRGLVLGQGGCSNTIPVSAQCICQRLLIL